MTITEARQQTRLHVQAAAAVCEDKKGQDTRILELDPVDSGLSDFFLITSASNERQAVAIADEIEFRLKKEFGLYANSVEGRRQGEWVLLDYVDFVVHVFLTERRAFYDIERLRKSARPLTPAEFDAELKAELAAKTVAVRGKSTAKKKPAKKAAVKKTPAKAAAKKAAAKKAVALKPAAKKSALKPAAKKAVAKKATAKKTAAKTVPAKKTAVKKAVAKPVAKKAVGKKTPAKKTAVKAVPAKKAASKTAVKKAVAKKAPAKKSAAKKVAAKKSR
jgi:ribosome-associated protein